MDERELRSLLAAHIGAALNGGAGSDPWAAQRMRADKYYNGEPRGDEKDGRSQVVSRDVAEAIDGMMPSLMRIFSSGDRVVEFQPNGPEDQAVADQATDYINWIWNQQNNGFRIFHDWFKSALLYRLGVLKIWWDNSSECTREKYSGITAQEIDVLHADPAIESVVQRERQEDGQAVFDVTAMRRRGAGRVRIMAVPPEEFLIGPHARSLAIEECGFIAHRVERSLSDLVALGYDRALLVAAGAAQHERFSPEKIQRFHEENGLRHLSDGGLDPSQRRIPVYECYLKVDFDGDGIAEMRKVTLAGGEGDIILENEEVDDHPFASLSPILQPFKLIGKSLADYLYDIQDIKTAIWRRMLDNIYIAVDHRMAVVENQVNLDDLLTVRPGGIIRVKSAGAIQPLPHQNILGDAYQLIEYADSVRENRVGVTRYNQGLDADTLNQTATGIAQIMNAGQQRIELIARVFAETGVAAAFRKILRLVCQHQNFAQIIRLRGAFVAMDPREWKDDYDVTVTVGLGTGDRDREVQRLLQFIGLDNQVLQFQAATGSVMLTPKNIYNKLAKLIQAAGLKTPDSYYTDPDSETARQILAERQQAQAQSGVNDPQQMQLALAQRKLEADIASQAARIQGELAIKARKAQDEIALAQAKLNSKE
ncbi:MAG TPA: hypothetical protein VHL08_04625 [Dongiaceae bacterium]|jgi:hypothetical protein|nr:hypothetical protein [Dongiaceae bacterium]